MDIILASASPRRRELFKRTGLPFLVTDSGIKEEFTGVEPVKIAVHLARQKAAAVSSLYECGIVVAADTIIDLDGETLGKPESPEHALQMLLCLRGKEHQVITAVAVKCRGEQRDSYVSTTVRMRAYSTADIEQYVDSGEPMDKAGAYAIQGLGSRLVEGIQGCYFNVIGLPLCEVCRLLGHFGVFFAVDGPVCLLHSGDPCPRSERSGPAS